MAEAPGGKPFLMQGAREVLATGMVYFEQQVTTIEKAVSDDPGMAISMTYSLVDTACKTILTNRGYSYDSDWDLPKTMKETLQRLPIAPPGAEKPAESAEAVKKVVNSMNTAIQGLCELRRLHGASHGKDGYAQQPGLMHAMLAARLADAIVNFLFGCHRRVTSTEPTRRLVYEDHEEFNRYLDEAHDAIRILDLEYSPSEVLFNTDQEAYRDALANFDNTGDEAEADTPASPATESTA